MYLLINVAEAVEAISDTNYELARQWFPIAIWSSIQWIYNFVYPVSCCDLIKKCIPKICRVR